MSDFYAVRVIDPNWNFHELWRREEGGLSIHWTCRHLGDRKWALAAKKEEQAKGYKAVIVRVWRRKK